MKIKDITESIILIEGDRMERFRRYLLKFLRWKTEEPAQTPEEQEELDVARAELDNIDISMEEIRHLLDEVNDVTPLTNDEKLEIRKRAIWAKGGSRLQSVASDRYEPVDKPRPNLRSV